MKNKLIKQELVFEKRGEAVTNSRDLATIFNKNHKSVLRAIDNLIAQNCAVKNMFLQKLSLLYGRESTGGRKETLGGACVA